MNDRIYQLTKAELVTSKESGTAYYLLTFQWECEQEIKRETMEFIYSRRVDKLLVSGTERELVDYYNAHRTIHGL